MTVQQAFVQAVCSLRRAGIQDAREQARFLLQFVLEADATRLLLRFPEEMPGDAQRAYDALLARRLRGEPLQYILGSEDFMGVRFLVRPGALIPRPDTQALVCAALRDLRDLRNPRVWDVCCGSGAVGLTVALRRPDARVTLSDISPDCLALTRENAERLRVAVRVFPSDLLQSAPADERFDAAIANPPYIPDGDLDGLQVEVRDFEPRLALAGGADGLDFFRKLAAQARRVADRLLLEVGDGQAGRVVQLLRANGYLRVKAHRDEFGAWRVVRGDCPPRANTEMGERDE